MPSTFLGRTKPVVNTAGYLDEVIDATIAALGKYPANAPVLFHNPYNVPPGDIHKRYGHVDFVRHLNYGQPDVHQGEIGTVLHRLAEAITFMLNSHKVYPRREIGEYLLEQSLYALPTVRGFQQAPYTSDRGKVYILPGYDPGLGLWLWTPEATARREPIYTPATEEESD